MALAGPSGRGEAAQLTCGSPSLLAPLRGRAAGRAPRAGSSRINRLSCDAASKEVTLLDYGGLGEGSGIGAEAWCIAHVRFSLS